jgi:hypothetical protein
MWGAKPKQTRSLFARPAAETSGSAAGSLSQTSSRLFSPSLPQESARKKLVKKKSIFNEKKNIFF